MGFIFFGGRLIRQPLMRKTKALGEKFFVSASVSSLSSSPSSSWSLPSRLCCCLLSSPSYTSSSPFCFSSLPRSSPLFLSAAASSFLSPSFSSVSAVSLFSSSFFSISSHCSYHTDQSFSDGTDGAFRPHPFNRRFAFSPKPFFPIEPRNLRIKGLNRRKKRRGRGDKASARGIRGRNSKQKLTPHSRTYEGGQMPLYRRLPKWPEAYLSRFPITQRHLHESGCVKVKNGVRLFNVNDYPFPYHVNIEVAGSDQSSIDMINRVGGSITITYMDRVNLRAHVKPHKFEVLPKSARPNLEMLHYLEKMKARGCRVRYIKPLWLIEEEQRIKTELMEFEADNAIADGRVGARASLVERESQEEHEEQLLRKFRVQKPIRSQKLMTC